MPSNPAALWNSAVPEKRRIDFDREAHVRPEIHFNFLPHFDVETIRAVLTQCQIRFGREFGNCRSRAAQFLRAKV